MHLIINANCTSGAIAASMGIFFPEAILHIVPGEPSEANRSFIKSTIDSIKGEKYYVLSIWDERLADIVDSGNLIGIPLIFFDAFHPDLVYCNKKSNNAQLTVPHYNSRIILQSFRMGFPFAKVQSLFCDNTYFNLGYYNYWKSSERALLSNFLKAGYSKNVFVSFFRKIQRYGVFMHTVNHPKVEVILELSKLIASRIKPEINYDLFKLNIPDALVGSYIFPVYPEIGFELALPGDYIWAVGNINFNLTNFIEYSYSNYIDQNFNPDDLGFDITDSQINYFNEIN